MALSLSPRGSGLGYEKVATEEGRHQDEREREREGEGGLEKGEGGTRLKVFSKGGDMNRQGARQSGGRPSRVFRFGPGEEAGGGDGHFDHEEGKGGGRI